MKKIIGAALAMAPVILIGGVAHATAGANTSSATATVSTTILAPISVTKNTDLAFGTVVKPNTGTSTFTVTNAGALTVTGGGDGAAVASNVHSAASFTVNGEGGQAFTLAVPASVVLAGPSSASLTVTTTNDAGCTSACALSSTLGNAGAF